MTKVSLRGRAAPQRGRTRGGAKPSRGKIKMTLPRLIFVTGKGGTGKSTVAAALALALSRRRPTTLADLDRRLSAAALLGAVPHNSNVIKVTGSLDVIALTPRTELEAFIE